MLPRSSLFSQRFISTLLDLRYSPTLRWRNLFVSFGEGCMSVPKNPILRAFDFLSPAACEPTKCFPLRLLNIQCMFHWSVLDLVCAFIAREIAGI